MIGQIAHVGVTVTDMEKSKEFYGEILGLKYQGEFIMEGPETDRLFDMNDCKVRVCYFNGSDHVMTPPVELIKFISPKCKKEEAELTRTSISEICFVTDDIEKVYNMLIEKGVECLSEPQYFDYTDCGFGKSKAIYFKDPDGIILELTQNL